MLHEESPSSPPESPELVTTSPQAQAASAATPKKRPKRGSIEDLHEYLLRKGLKVGLCGPDHPVYQSGPRVAPKYLAQDKRIRKANDGTPDKNTPSGSGAEPAPPSPNGQR